MMFSLVLTALLITVSSLFLICNSLATKLSLFRHKLHEPIETELAMHKGDQKIIVQLYEYMKLCLYDSSAGVNSDKQVTNVQQATQKHPLTMLDLPPDCNNFLTFLHSQTENAYS